MPPRYAGRAKAVHVHGSGRTGGSPIELDLRLVAGEGGAGTLLTNGLRFEMVRIGDRAYFKGDEAFWRQVGGDAAVELLRGRWLAASATTGVRWDPGTSSPSPKACPIPSISRARSSS